MTMDDAKHNENRDILKDLTETAPEGVAPVLKCYDYDTDGDYIRKKLNAHYKKELQTAADYLKQLPAEFKYKEDLVKAIINRMDNLLLEDCRKCKQYYTVGREDIPTVSCSSCGQGAHDSCYKDLGTILAEHPGLHYQCSRCDSTEVSEPKKKLNIGGPAAAADATVQPQQHTPRSMLADVTVSDHDESEEPMNRIWQRLRRGVCPHGISGLTMFNGHICEFRHLKRCQKFCHYGTDESDGCNKGRECDLLHPILCRFSVQFKMCTNLKCRFTHLTGTKRYRPRDSYCDQQVEMGRHNGRSDDRRHYNHNPHEESHAHHQREGYNRAYPPLPQNQNPRSEGNNSNPSNANLSFLSQLTDTMKEIQKEMKVMYKPYQQPPYTYTNYSATPMGIPQIQTQARPAMPQMFLGATQMANQQYQNPAAVHQ